MYGGGRRSKGGSLEEDYDGDRESGGLSRVEKWTADLRKRGQGSVATATLKSGCAQTMSSD